jgi:hypothetical protein
VAGNRQPIYRAGNQEIESSPDQTGGPPARFVEKHGTQWPADRAGEAGDQGNSGDGAAGLAAIEPRQGSKGRIVKPHADADAKHRPGDNEARGAVRLSKDDQAGSDDQVGGGEKTASAMPVDQPPDRGTNDGRQQ